MKAATRRSLVRTGRKLGLTRAMRYAAGLVQEPSLAGELLQDRDAATLGTFTDSSGDLIELRAGLRDRLKPDWREMFLPPKPWVPASPSVCRDAIRARRRLLDRADGSLQAFSLSLAGKAVLEIGTYDGATAYALAEVGAQRVVATDIASYYISQSPGRVVSETAVAEANADLTRLRNAYRAVIDDEVAGRVTFREDDICCSTLESESVDAVMSWEVLEHLTDPVQAFAHMARVLRTGGFAFHEYNPFFALDGGHSPCTLDFLWGHARLAAADFERYLDERRPSEKPLSLSFYHHNLNRMTFAELEHCARGCGLSVLCLLPWYSRDHLGLMDSAILESCRRIYPSAQLADLISPTVWVLLRKGE